MREMVLQKPMLDNTELVKLDGTWRGEKTIIGETNNWRGKKILKEETQRIFLYSTRDGTICQNTTISDKKGKESQNVILYFKRDGTLNEIGHITADKNHPWDAKREELEKDMKEFLKHSEVKGWLEEMNKSHRQLPPILG